MVLCSGSLEVAQKRNWLNGSWQRAHIIQQRVMLKSRNQVQVINDLRRRALEQLIVSFVAELFKRLLLQSSAKHLRLVLPLSHDRSHSWEYGVESACVRLA